MTGRFVAVLGLLLALASPAWAGPVFSDDFESGLTQWVGKSGGAHHGATVVDPLAPAGTDDVLSFTQTNSAGDIFTSTAAFAPGTYEIEFDYLGLPPVGTAYQSNGYMGISPGLPGTPHDWLWATGTVSGASAVLIDDRTWHHYNFTFTSTYAFHLMLEDYSGQAGAGDAFWDDIKLTAAVPEPASLALFGLGIAALAARRRRRV